MIRKILSISLFILILFLITGCDDFNSINSCKSACNEKGFESGNCMWERETTEDFFIEVNEQYPYSEIESIGGCTDKSKHCFNKGACYCYCYNLK